MASKLAFGSYIPGTSPVHKLNAQVKVVLACAFSIAAFFVNGWIGLAALWLMVVIAYGMARVPLSKAAAGLKPVVIILAFTVLAHAFTFQLGHPLQGLSAQGSLGLQREWVISGSFGLSLDGTFCGFFFAFRIAVLVAACCLLTFTTSSVELTDGLLAIMRPLRKLKVPVEDVAMIISIALRFIPTTAQEAMRIADAQRARCADFDSGNLLKRLGAWFPVLVPLFVRLFKRADELACAMDARCYVGQGRTHMRSCAVHGPDVAALVVIVAALCALCVFL